MKLLGLVFTLSLLAATPVDPPSVQSPMPSVVPTRQDTGAPGRPADISGLLGQWRWGILGGGVAVLLLLYASHRMRSAAIGRDHHGVEPIQPRSSKARASPRLPPKDDSFDDPYAVPDKLAGYEAAQVPRSVVQGTRSPVTKDQPVVTIRPVSPVPAGQSGGWGSLEIRKGAPLAPEIRIHPQPLRVGEYTFKGERADDRQRLAHAFQRLERETGLDYVSSGSPAPVACPPVLARMLEVQNGGRFGRGWFLMLGWNRRDMDLMAITNDPGVMRRFGQGWCLGITALCDTLYLSEDGHIEIRRQTGRCEDLGTNLTDVIENLGRDPLARNRLAEMERVERFRAIAGDLALGHVYLPASDAGLGADPVERWPFLDAIRHLPPLDPPS